MSVPAEKPRDPLEAGMAHHRAGNIKKAEQNYKRALAARPGDPAALHLLGLAAFDRGRPERALQLIAKALERAPGHPDFLHSAGHVLQALGQVDEAVERYRAALATDPDRALTRSNLGNALKRAGRMDEAAAELAHAVEIDPDFAEGWSNLGLAEKERGRFDDALAAFARAERLKPGVAAFPYNSANTLAAAGRRDEAVEAFYRVLEMEPAHAGALANLGAVLRQSGHLDAALEILESGRLLAPASAELRWNLGLTRLMAGQWQQGFEDFEARRDIPGMSVALPRGAPRDGRPMPGRTLLIQHEQGFGDAIQFLRFARDAEKLGVRVIYRGPRALLPLASRMSGIAGTVAQEEAPPRFDCWLPMMSLPHVLKATSAHKLERGGYLAPATERMALWRERLAGTKGCHIGIGWQGNPSYAADGERSIPLAHFAALADLPGLELISLQKGAGHEQLADWPADIPAPRDLGAEIDRDGKAFMDTAAILPSLDVVVTSDSALAHLAGAVGVPTFMALPQVPDWRWGLEGERSVWYPTLHVFRQRQRGDWDQVFGDIKEALGARIGVHG